MSPADRRIIRVEGRAMAVRGDDIDTDRIIPARFLRCVTFEGLGEHAFEDDRKGLAAKGKLHPFDDPRHRGASVLVVNRNFACGSSREHAPQSLLRWGIRAVVGESFAEIFFGNCLALGLPCLTAEREGIEDLMRFAEENPQAQVTIDIASGDIASGDISSGAVSAAGGANGLRIPGRIRPGPREAFLKGAWDATGLLLDRYQEVEAVAGRLPYLSGF